MTFGVAQVDVDFDDRPALRGVSVEVPGGAVAAVVGGDGAGKSTLLRCLVGQVAPASGTVARPSKRDVGYMAATSGTWPQLTVSEHFDLVGSVYRLGSHTVRARRTALLDKAGLTGAADRLAGRLSGGMRQKLGFCLAVLHQPPLLVLDEPSTGVDAVSRVDLWRLISEAAANGTAVIMATSYLDEAERAATVLVLDAGRTLLSGTPAAVLATFTGEVVAVDRPDDSGWCWRRGREFHRWCPDGPPADARPTAVDLEDTVIAAMLRARRVTGNAATEAAHG